MNATTRLLLLSADPAADATWLQVDADGRILARGVANAGTPLAADASGSRPRQWLVVPGINVAVQWLELPARNPVQAQAAARLLLGEHLATGHEAVHIAIGPPSPRNPARPVAAVDPTLMRTWLDRAATLGMQPEVVVPAPLLLPLAEPAREAAHEPQIDEPHEFHAGADATTMTGATDGKPVRVAMLDGCWLVRGEQLAFAAEPALAAQVIGARPVEHIADAAAAMAATTTAPLNLLQYDFAPTSARPQGWPAYRRTVMLVVALLVSPLVMLAAQTLRHGIAARDLQAQALEQARLLQPSLADDADPVPTIRAHRDRLLASDQFARSTGTLLRAIESLDRAELDALSYADGELHATLVHATTDDVERLRTALAASALELIETGTRSQGDRVLVQFTVRPAA